MRRNQIRHQTDEVPFSIFIKHRILIPYYVPFIPRLKKQFGKGLNWGGGEIGEGMGIKIKNSLFAAAYWANL